MDRRVFLTGMLGLAGAAAMAGALRPGSAVAGIPAGNGILDELDAPAADILGPDPAQAEPVQYRRHRPPPRPRRRRPVWRRVCRQYWDRGRRRVRCYRRRVWVWY